MPDLRYKWKRSCPLYSLVSRILLSLVSRDIFFDTRCIHWTFSIRKTQMRRHCHLKGMVIKVKHLSVVSSFDVFSQRKSRCILLLLFYVCLHLSCFILTLLFLSIPCSSFCFDDCQWYTWGFVWRCESGHELHFSSHSRVIVPCFYHMLSLLEQGSFSRLTHPQNQLDDSHERSHFLNNLSHDHQTSNHL